MYSHFRVFFGYVSPLAFRSFFDVPILPFRVYFVSLTTLGSFQDVLQDFFRLCFPFAFGSFRHLSSHFRVFSSLLPLLGLFFRCILTSGSFSVYVSLLAFRVVFVIILHFRVFSLLPTLESFSDDFTSRSFRFMFPFSL